MALTRSKMEVLLQSAEVVHGEAWPGTKRGSSLNAMLARRLELLLSSLGLVYTGDLLVIQKMAVDGNPLDKFDWLRSCMSVKVLEKVGNPVWAEIVCTNPVVSQAFAILVSYAVLSGMARSESNDLFRFLLEGNNITKNDHLMRRTLRRHCGDAFEEWYKVWDMERKLAK